MLAARPTPPAPAHCFCACTLPSVGKTPGSYPVRAGVPSACRLSEALCQAVGAGPGSVYVEVWPRVIATPQLGAREVTSWASSLETKLKGGKERQEGRRMGRGNPSPGRCTLASPWALHPGLPGQPRGQTPAGEAAGRGRLRAGPWTCTAAPPARWTRWWPAPCCRPPRSSALRAAPWAPSERRCESAGASPATGRTGASRKSSR